MSQVKAPFVKRLDKLTRKWWFVVLLILMGAMMPPYVSKGTVEPSKIGEVVTHILANAIVNAWAPYGFVFKIIPLVLIIGLVFSGNKFGRLFSLYVGFSYILFAFLQGIAITEQYGFAMVTGNVVSILFVAALWFWEAFIGQNVYNLRGLPLSRYWVAPLAVLAFWWPIDLGAMTFDFNPVYFVTNMAGLTFCMMTPVYLSVLILCYPKINLPVFRVTAIVGLLIGFWNVVTDFFLQPSLWAMGVLHLPLIVLSFYSTILAFRRKE